MQLLFKETGFDKQFRELLGFVDASYKFVTMRPELITATRQMIDIIGKDLYATACNAYNANLPEGQELEEKDKWLLYNIQYPIALNAYRLSAHTRDLSHTTNGRLMRVEENEKQAFEWMLNRDDKNQERKYYRAIDDLLEFLEEENISDWKASESYKKLNRLFVSTTKDFDSCFPINSRLLLLKLQPGLRKCEREDILAFIGQERFDTLKQEQLAGQVAEENKDLLELIKNACVYSALSWAMKRLTVTLFPEGVLQSYTSDRMSAKATKTPEYMQTQLASQEFQKDAVKIFADIQSLITKEQPKPNNGQEENLDFTLGFDKNDPFATT